MSRASVVSLVRGDPRTLVRIAWCGLATSAVVLTGDISWWVSVIVLTLIPVIGLAPPEARWRLAARRLSAWFTFLYLLFFLVDVFVLSQGLIFKIFAFLHLTFYLKLYTLLHQDRARERARLHLLCVFEMLAAASMTVSVTFVVPLSLFVILGTLVFTLEQTRPERVDRVLLRGAAATALVVGVPVLVLAAVCFVALPRAAYGGFRLGGLTGITSTGFSEKVRLGDFEEIRRDSEIVMRIISDDATASAPRWRGPAYDHYEDGEWHQTMSGASALPRARRGGFLLDRPSSAPHAKSQVFMEPLDTDVLFLPPASASIETTVRYVFVDPYLTLRTGRSGRAGRRYTVSWRHRATPETSPVGGVERLSRRARRLYTQVPSSLSPRFHDLAATVVSSDNRLGAARGLERFLKTEYGYTLEQPRRVHTDPLEDFLFDARAGHCEYFASAMVLMLRSRGIPSRLVTGFSRGQQNALGEFEVVRKSNAHAWVEVFDSQRGWVAFDPTPPSLEVEGLAAVGILSQGIDSLRMLWDVYVVAFDVQRQRGVLGGVSELGDAASAAVVRGMGWVRRHGRALLFCVLLAGLVWILLRSRWARRWGVFWCPWLSDLSRPRPQSSIVFYERMLILLSRLGIDKPPAQTAFAFALSKEEDLPGITELTGLYYRARFRGEILGADEAAHADRLASTIRLTALSDARRES